MKHVPKKPEVKVGSHVVVDVFVFDGLLEPNG